MSFTTVSFQDMMKSIKLQSRGEIHAKFPNHEKHFAFDRKLQFEVNGKRVSDLMFHAELKQANEREAEFAINW